MRLKDNTINKIQTILHKYLSNYDYEAFIFGSWATGNARENSDIDLGIKILNEKYEKTVLQNIKNAFIESDIPNVIDLVDFNETSKEFSEVSLNKIIPLT